MYWVFVVVVFEGVGCVEVGFVVVDVVGLG